MRLGNKVLSVYGNTGQLLTQSSPNIKALIYCFLSASIKANHTRFSAYAAQRFVETPH
jgi:hypothetical protein